MLHLEAEASQPFRQQINLGGFAGAIQSFHGYEIAFRHRCAGAKDVNHILHRFRIGLASSFPQFRFRAIAVANSNGVNADSTAALHIEFPVADHPCCIPFFRQGGADQLFLVRTHVFPGAYHSIKILVQPEILHNPLGGNFRLACRHGHVPALLLQCPKQTANTGINAVFKQSHIIIPHPVKPQSFLCFLLGHTAVFLKGPAEGRADKLPQGRLVQGRQMHFLKGILGALKNALLRLG